MIKNSQDDNSGVLESSRSPAEALRQQIELILSKLVYAVQQDEIVTGEKAPFDVAWDDIMELVTAYAATVEREAANRTALAVLQGLEFYVRWDKTDELPAEISKRLAALQGPIQGDSK